MTGFGVIRQWCEICQRATESWIDAQWGGVTRCATHEPPDRREAWDPDYMDD